MLLAVLPRTGNRPWVRVDKCLPCERIQAVYENQVQIDYRPDGTVHGVMSPERKSPDDIARRGPFGIIRPVTSAVPADPDVTDYGIRFGAECGKAAAPN